jgi:alpha-glucosidase/alpha-D-xyloside xylohydrolase
LAGQKEFAIGKLRVRVSSQPLQISVIRKDGTSVQDITIQEVEGTNELSFRMTAPVLGLGEGGPQFDRRGSFYPMINGQLSPLLATHGATIPVPFLIGTEGWAMFIHRPWGKFDLRGDTGRFLLEKRSVGSEPLDLFIIDAPQPPDALAAYVQLFGHPVMPPKWTMGYIQSHRTLLGPDDALHIAETFREKKLPCDALIYLGTGYCTNGWNTGHGSLEFNPNAFNDPPKQIQALHDLNFKVIFHINHAPKDMFGTRIKNVATAGSKSKSAAADASAGSDTEDFSSPLHIGNYWERHRKDFALGVDGWWPDDGDELPIEARLARHRCYYEGPLLDRPNERPWSLHRNGFAGVARYGGWIWSGDTVSRWATLAAHVPVGVNYSLSLTPFWGSDTGGFVATSELTGELYTRWFQFSAFNPIFRSHGRTWHLRLPWGWDLGEYGPIETPGRPDPSELHNPEVERICRKFLELRYQLLPYNYTLMREACDTGMPPMRALWLHYPKDPEAVKLGDEYLWGRDLLVAPVVEKGATTRRVYLPAGDWYDWWTKERLHGARWIERPVTLETMPMFARAGAIIPLDPVRQYTSQKVNEATTLLVFPGADGEFIKYDDDGASLDYLKGQGMWTRLRWNDRTHTLTVEPDPRSKLKTAGPKEYDVLQAGEGARKTLQYAGHRVEVKL